jgi:Protein of unknown function (DUF1254)
MTVSSETLHAISTPDRLDSRVGTLESVDGVPSGETAELVYDHLDFVHGLNVYLDGFAGASTYALRKGFHELGVEDNTILIFSELMGSESVFLTANADTVYFLGIVDLTSGPMVVETPPQALGVIDDMWWGWIIDFGLPGPDRGEGGRFLLVPPGYDGPLPDSGYHVGQSRTSRALVLGRSFLTDDDPAPTVETIKSTLKLYPYAPGNAGTSIATLLEGYVQPAPPAQATETVFVEGSGKAFNTVPPSDFGFFELINEAVQDEPAGSTDAGLLGHLAAIGIVKGKPFEPNERMRRTLEEAAAVGATTSRTLFFDPRASEEFTYYDGSAWFNPLWVGGYTFETPPPLVTDDGIKPFPATGIRRDARDVHEAHRGRVAVPDGGQGRRRRSARRGKELPGDAPTGHPGRAILVDHPLRQPDALDAADTAALPARRQPVLSDTGSDRRQRRLHDRRVRPGAARGYPGEQLDPDDGRQGVVPDPAPLQPTRFVLRQELAAERDRSREHKPMIEGPTNRRGNGHP